MKLKDLFHLLPKSIIDNSLDVFDLYRKCALKISRFGISSAINCGKASKLLLGILSDSFTGFTKNNLSD